MHCERWQPFSLLFRRRAPVLSIYLFSCLPASLYAEKGGHLTPFLVTSLSLSLSGSSTMAMSAKRSRGEPRKQWTQTNVHMHMRAPVPGAVPFSSGKFFRTPHKQSVAALEESAGSEQLADTSLHQPLAALGGSAQSELEQVQSAARSVKLAHDIIFNAIQMGQVRGRKQLSAVVQLNHKCLETAGLLSSQLLHLEYDLHSELLKEN